MRTRTHIIKSLYKKKTIVIKHLQDNISSFRNMKVYLLDQYFYSEYMKIIFKQGFEMLDCWIRSYARGYVTLFQPHRFQNLYKKDKKVNIDTML